VRVSRHHLHNDKKTVDLFAVAKQRVGICTGWEKDGWSLYKNQVLNIVCLNNLFHHTVLSLSYFYFNDKHTIHFTT